MFTGPIVWKGIVYATLMVLAKAATGLVLYVGHMAQRWQKKKSVGPGTELEDRSLTQGLPHADAMLVGFAMVARGEIGFLIASLSQSSGTLSLRSISDVAEKDTDIRDGEELFLVIVWAVVLCTIVGPVMIGSIARRQIRRDGIRQSP
jgi:Kef-type K+ transport system membrane component KefB